MGPAAAIGMIGYFRGLMGAWQNTAQLSSEGPADDSHPADIVRGYLAASTVRLLSFKQKAAWANAIEAETDKDLTAIVLAGHSVTQANAKAMAKIVAGAIATTPLQTLEKRSLRSIQDWKDADESISVALKAVLVKAGTKVPEAIAETSYATHVVAAAVSAAVLGEATPAKLFTAMLGMLKVMHDDNPVWGPLFVAHRGNSVRHGVAKWRRAAKA
jgi:hypothetical protein